MSRPKKIALTATSQFPPPIPKTQAREYQPDNARAVIVLLSRLPHDAVDPALAALIGCWRDLGIASVFGLPRSENSRPIRKRPSGRPSCIPTRQLWILETHAIVAATGLPKGVVETLLVAETGYRVLLGVVPRRSYVARRMWAARRGASDANNPASKFFFASMQSARAPGASILRETTSVAKPPKRRS